MICAPRNFTDVMWISEATKRRVNLMRDQSSVADTSGFHLQSRPLAVFAITIGLTRFHVEILCLVETVAFNV